MNYEHEDWKRGKRKSEIIKMLHRKKQEMSHHEPMKYLSENFLKQHNISEK